MHFEIHPEAKRMARRTGQILLLTLLLRRQLAPAQLRAQSVPPQDRCPPLPTSPSGRRTFLSLKATR